MKKIYSFLTAALLTATAASAQVTLPYELGTTPPDLVTTLADAKDNWSVFNPTGEATWVVATNYKNGDYYPYRLGVASQQDDWLTSPAFKVKASTEYKITFDARVQASCTLENFEVYFTSYNPIQDATMASYYDHQSFPISNTGYQTFTFTAATEDGEEGAEYYFSFRASGAQTGVVCVSKVIIEEVSKGEEPEQPVEPGDHVCSKIFTPYSSTIAVKDGSYAIFDTGWKQIDANNDNSIWSPISGGTECSAPSKLYAQYKWNSSNPGNDYLISPAIHLEAGKDYVVEFGYQTKNLEEIVTLYASESNVPADILAGEKLLEKKGSFSTWAKNQVSFTPTTTGDYYFSFHCTSVKDKYYAFVSDFSVKEDIFAPAAVTNFTATADPNKTVKVLLSWTLPTASATGKPFSDSQTVEKVEIYRDGGETPIATLNGPVTTYEDTEETGLTTGKHKYSIVVTVAGVKSETVQSNETKYVGPIAATSIPATFTIDTNDDFETYYTVVHGENSTVDYPSTYNGWIYYSYNKEVKFIPGTNKTEEDILFFPPLAVSEAGYYRVTVTSKLYSAQPYSYKYVIAPTPSISAMTVLGQVEDMGTSYADHYFDFYVAEAGTYYIGILADGQNSSNQYFVNKIKVESSEFIPGQVTDLTTTVGADEALKFTASWVNPTTSFAGGPCDKSQYKIEVYLNKSEQPYTTLEGSAITDGTQTLTIPVTEPGVYTVTVKTVNLNGKSEGVAPSAKTKWVGPIPAHECNGLQTPYTSTIAKASNQWDEGWKNMDVNNDSKTWVATYSSSANPSLYAQYSYHGSNAGNDFLVSPAIHLDAGKEYYVVYNMRVYSSGNPENLTLYASTSAETADEILEGEIIDQHLSYTTTANTTFKKLFVPDLAGDYHFSFHAHSAANKYYIYVSDFSVLENVFAPKGVSNFTATAAPNRELKVNLAWTLPTTSAFDEPFTEEQTIESVALYRDGGEEPIATLAGDATSFEDTAETGLTSGKHTYKIVVTVAGVKSSAVSSNETNYVGPVAPVAIPVTFSGFNAQDLADIYTILYGASSTVDHNRTNTGWHIYSYTDGGYTTQLRFNGGYNKQEDDMLICPPLAVTAPGYYRVTLSARVENTNPSLYKYVVGTTPTMEGMEVVGIAEGLTNTSYTDNCFDFYAPEAGTYYVGVYANRSPLGSSGAFLRIGKIEVTQSKFLPGVVSDLTVTPAADGALSMTASWTNPTTSFAGGACDKSQYKIEVYLNDSETPYTTLEGDAITDGTQTLDIAVSEAGIYTVTVKTVTTDENAESAPVAVPSVTTSWVGPKLVNVPYSITFNNYASDPTTYFWDVKDGNNDGKSWKLSASGSIGYYTLSGASKDSNGLYQYDDFLFSPEMTLTAGQNYGVTYNMSGANATKFHYTIGVVAADLDFNADHATWVASESRSLHNPSLTSAGTDYTYAFTVPADGKYKIVIAADELQGTEHTGQYIPRLYKFTVEVPAPGVATELTVMPDPNYALEAVVSWINPANDAYGNEMSMGAITKAVIYRGTTTADLAEIGTITEIDNLNPGATSMFVDAEVPAPGSYTYKVEIYNEAGCAANAATVKSPWIGGGTEIPATGGVGIGKDIENNDSFDRGFSSSEWRVLSTNGYVPTFSMGATRLGITGWNSDPDAWAMSKDLYQFEKNTLYEVTVRSHCGGGNDNAPSFKMFIGGSDVDTDDLSLASNKDKWEGSFTQIGEWSIPVTTTTTNNAQKETFLVYFVDPASMVSLMSVADEAPQQPTTADDDPDVAASTKIAAGPARLAFNSQSKGDYYIDAVKLAVKRKFTTGMDEIEAAANGVVFDGTAINFNGKASVVVYNMTGTLVLADKEAVDTVSMEHLANGAYIVSVVPENGKAVTFKVVK